MKAYYVYFVVYDPGALSGYRLCLRAFLEQSFIYHTDAEIAGNLHVTSCPGNMMFPLFILYNQPQLFLKLLVDDTLFGISFVFKTPPYWAQNVCYS